MTDPSPMLVFDKAPNPASHAIVEDAWPLCDHRQPGASTLYKIIYSYMLFTSLSALLEY